MVKHMWHKAQHLPKHLWGLNVFSRPKHVLKTTTSLVVFNNVFTRICSVGGEFLAIFCVLYF